LTVFIVANVPPELLKEFMQHVRNFDAAHPGCHFKIVANAPDMPMSAMIETLRLDPELASLQTFPLGK
jgi:hypothetical protein